MSDEAKKEKLKQELQSLIALQEIDNEIKDFQKLQDIIPGQISSGQKELEGKKGRLNSAQAEIEELKKKRNQLEQDVKVENDHMAKTKAKLPTVKTNKEYTAILHETDAIKEKIAGMEDQQLEIMEQLDQMEAELPAIESEFMGYQDEFTQYKKQKEAEQERVQNEKTEAQNKRDALAKGIDPKWVQHYDRVMKLRGGPAVVPLEGEICQGCHRHILPQMAIEVKSGEKVHQCQHCNRFLYVIPKPETEESTETAVPK